MRAILESYDSELAATEYSPQLNKRLKEAEDVLQRTQSHYVEMEVSFHAFANAPHSVCIHTDSTPYSRCLLWDWVTVKGTESVFAKAKAILCFILRVLYRTRKIWHKYQDWWKVKNKIEKWTSDAPQCHREEGRRGVDSGPGIQWQWGQQQALAAGRRAQSLIGCLHLWFTSVFSYWAGLLVTHPGSFRPACWAFTRVAQLSN